MPGGMFVQSCRGFLIPFETSMVTEEVRWMSSEMNRKLKSIFCCFVTGMLRWVLLE